MKYRLVLTLFMSEIATVAFSQTSKVPGIHSQKASRKSPVDTLSSYLSPLYIPGNNVCPFGFKSFSSGDETEVTIDGDLLGHIAESFNDRMPVLVPKGDYTMPILVPTDSTKNYTLLKKQIH